MNPNGPGNNADNLSETSSTNEGSLVEDFADPNTEQPSHMDPED